MTKKISARCHCKRRRVSCPGPGRAAVVILAFVRPNKTAFMSDKCLIFGFACGVHRVPVRRARPRSIDVDFHQPKPAQPHPRSVPHTGGAIERRRGAQRPAGARRANGPLSRNGHILTVEETCWWELFWVANHDQLSTSCDYAKCVFRLYLGGLVHDYQIKLKLTGF